jgi:cellobiose phosphorylase
MKKTTQKRTRAPKSAQFRNRYGYYDEAAREYVITRPDTP